MNDKPQYRRCEIKGCPMLLRAPAVVCHDHRREMAGEWAAAEIALDRARVPVVPTSADPDGARSQVSPSYPRAETSL